MLVPRIWFAVSDNASLNHAPSDTGTETVEPVLKHGQGSIDRRDFVLFFDRRWEVYRCGCNSRPDEKRNPHRGNPRHGGNLPRRHNGLGARTNQPNLASLRSVADRNRKPCRFPLVRSKHYAIQRCNGARSFATRLVRSAKRPPFNPGDDVLFSS